jgi:hypothetical protein
MRIKSRVAIIAICVVAMLASGVVFAQEARQEKDRKARTRVFVEEGGAVIATDGPLAPGVAIAGDAQRERDTVVFLSTEMSFDDKIVKGAPYSAQAVTEHVHTLSDGNRIVRKSSSSVYRDGEGRTRRDQKIEAVGPWAANGEAMQMIFINDPVAGVSYVFDTRERTARKLPNFHIRTGENGAKTIAIAPSRVPGPPLSVEERRHIEIAVAPHASTKKVREDSENVKTESLGKQVIEGVEAEGTRTTVTIPAGEIGNEHPINIVSEKWYSPELQVVVMSKHSDPRMGENTYRLTNISRSEPARSLFEVPSEYTIKEGEGPMVAPRPMRRKMQQQ